MFLTRIKTTIFFLVIQQSLREKSVELQAVTLQEKRLMRGERICSAVTAALPVSHLSVNVVYSSVNSRYLR